MTADLPPKLQSTLRSMIRAPVNSTKSDASHFAGIGHATPEIGMRQLGN
jgi:hypothetical protein